MFERLDEIDWGSLHHGFGKALDTPRWIRDLTADDERVRSNAQGELFGTIWNQWTVYDASAHAVPFLIELLEPPSLADKVGLLCLLACLATGVSELDGEARCLSGMREQAEVWAPPSFLGHELGRLGLPESRAEIQELLNLKRKG